MPLLSSTTMRLLHSSLDTCSQRRKRNEITEIETVSTLLLVHSAKKHFESRCLMNSESAENAYNPLPVGLIQPKQTTGSMLTVTNGCLNVSPQRRRQAHSFQDHGSNFTARVRSKQCSKAEINRYAHLLTLSECSLTHRVRRNNIHYWFIAHLVDLLSFPLRRLLQWCYVLFVLRCDSSGLLQSTMLVFAIAYESNRCGCRSVDCDSE